MNKTKIFKICVVLMIIIAVLLYKKIIHVDYISQDGYPTGCESASATMLLRHHGFNITIDEFVDNYLNKSDLEKNRWRFVWASSKRSFCRRSKK